MASAATSVTFTFSLPTLTPVSCLGQQVGSLGRRCEIVGSWRPCLHPGTACDVSPFRGCLILGFCTRSCQAKVVPFCSVSEASSCLARRRLCSPPVLAGTVVQVFLRGRSRCWVPWPVLSWVWFLTPSLWCYVQGARDSVVSRFSPVDSESNLLAREKDLENVLLPALWSNS